MDAARLGDVVRGLLLRVVGDVAGHGGGNNEGAVALLAEESADGLGAVGGAVEVDLDNVVPVGSGAVNDTSVGSSTGADIVSITSIEQIEGTYLATNPSILPKSLTTSPTNRSTSL